MGEQQESWTPVGGYEVTLDVYAEPAPEIRCRNASGRELKKLPPALKKEGAVLELAALGDWLADHAADARTRVENWMARSLPVPAALIHAVWSDPYWQRALRYAVVAPYGAGPVAGPDLARAGLLTGLETVSGTALHVASPEGEFTLDDAVLAVPHPVLLDPRGTGHLDQWLDLLDTFGGEQHIEQLHRTVWVRPDATPGHKEPKRYGIVPFRYGDYASGARFERVITPHGGRINGESAHFSVPVAGHTYGMQLDLRYQGPESPVSVHYCFWDGVDGRTGLGAYDPVPRVAWSEGMRVLAEVYEKADNPFDTQSARASMPADSTAAYQEFLVACAEYAATGPDPAQPPAPPVGPAAEGDLLRQGAVLAGAAAVDTEERLTARRYGGGQFDDGHRLVRLVPARAGVAEDVVAGALGLVPEGGDGVTVGRVRTLPLGFLARVCTAHPELARDAMALLTPLRMCAELAPAKPGRAADQFAKAAAKATAHCPGLLPYALDEAARVVAGAGSAAMARPLFAAARAAERKRSGRVDEEARQALFDEFVGLGAVTVKELTTHRQEVAARTSAARAADSYRSLVRTWCRSSRELPDAFAAELTRGAGGALPADDIHTEILGALLLGGAMDTCAPAVWNAWKPVLRRLMDEDPGAVVPALLKTVSAPRGRTAAKLSEAAGSWLAYLGDLGVLRRLTGDGADGGGTGETGGPDGTRGVGGLGGTGDDGGLRGTGGVGGPEGLVALSDTHRWLTRFLNGYEGMRLPVAGLEPVLAAIAVRTRAAGETRDPWDGARLRGATPGRVGLRLDLVVLLVRAGMPLAEPPGTGWRRMHLVEWMADHGTDEVVVLLGEPVLRERILNELTLRIREDLNFAGGRHELVVFPAAAVRLVECAPLREWAEDLVAERVRRLGEGGGNALFAFQDLMQHVEPFVLAGVGEPFEAGVRAALDVDLAEVLAQTLAARCADTTHRTADGVAPAADSEVPVEGPCPVRELTAERAGGLLASVGAELRALCASDIDAGPAKRTGRYLKLDEPRLLELLQPLAVKHLPGLSDRWCLQRFAGALTSVVACQTWQRGLRIPAPASEE
ncbi:DUF4132 domain-containing protein [Streptomyces sp. NBC_00237]|uniref:DUF4132 domain-containing protein n=1 Tax=Streptomyces sp. NBC_00237 TaxID=2975687 RepID=UPI00224E1983|nr:DUF4132 domain-containing protein [Streptomyces sp. NBC_00237]MCX5203603.1 DUF4132 domain-containing protein [Streptomyces sp. NBC_00237]